MIRQISNLDDEKEGEKKIAKMASRHECRMYFCRERKTAKSSFCPSKSQKLEQFNIRIFPSFSRANFFPFHCEFRVYRESLNSFSASHYVLFFYTLLENLFSILCANNAVIHYGKFSES